MKGKWVLLPLMLALLLVSCSTSGGVGKKPITITMWHNYGGIMQSSMDTLIREFNETKGREEGIIVKVTAVSSGSQLNTALQKIADGEPGAPEMPDIFTGYPKMAQLLESKKLITSLDSYFTKDELGKYVPAFVDEGRLPDGKLYVFPLAKSTEVLYVNQTLFDDFVKATGAKESDLQSFEGIFRLSKLYYEKTGKTFFHPDSWFNLIQTGMEQKGSALFDAKGDMNTSDPSYRYIFDHIISAVKEGGISVFDGYSSDLAKTGDVICSTGSSAGILFYGDTVTGPNAEERKVEYKILPYPVWEGGKAMSLQRGGGLMVANKDKKTIKAAAKFIQWLTSPAQNMRFISQTGYLPVTKQAFENDLTKNLSRIENPKVRSMLSAVRDMYKTYKFFTFPSFGKNSQKDRQYENSFRAFLKDLSSDVGGRKKMTNDLLIKEWQKELKSKGL